MAYDYKRTGPFTLIRIDTTDPKYLILEFDDIDPETGNASKRKLSKGGNWPGFFAEKLLEKAEPLVDQKVWVITSQTTKKWDTHKWLCNIEPFEVGEIKKELEEEEVKAADGVSNLADYLAIDDKCNLIDYSKAQKSLKKEEEYEIFWQNLTDGFESSWRDSKARTLDEDVKRIRVKGADKSTKRNGFRVVVWKAFEIANLNYFVVLRVDKKSEREEYLSNNEISEIKKQIKELEANYDSEQKEKIRKVIGDKYSKDA